MSVTDREREPGDVALVAFAGGEEMRATWATTCSASARVERSHPSAPHWHIADRETYLPAHATTVVRPLVVIDPEDREQVERLLTGYYTLLNRHLGPVTAEPSLVNDMQAALREVANSTPKPKEPMGWLAAVEDANGDRWVRDGLRADKSQKGQWWNHTTAAEKGYDGVLRADWCDIAAVRVLSEGVTP